jgi:hypothetical protein
MALSVPRWPRSKPGQPIPAGRDQLATPACTISHVPGALSMASALAPPNSVRS